MMSFFTLPDDGNGVAKPGGAAKRGLDSLHDPLSRTSHPHVQVIQCFHIVSFFYYVTILYSRSAFLNRRVVTQQRVVEDFERVVGLLKNDYYIAFLLKLR